MGANRCAADVERSNGQYSPRREFVVITRGMTSAVFAALLISLFVAPAAHAQDSHYWYDQFGNRALLLSGAVVGDPADLSSVYYNPGSLSLVEQTELLLAGLVINVGGTSVDDAVATGGDLSQQQFDVAPSLIAGEIPFGGSKHRFAYAVLKQISF